MAANDRIADVETVDMTYIGLGAAELTAQGILLLTHYRHPTACTDNYKQPW